LHYTKPDDTGLCHFHFAWTLRLRAQISLGDWLPDEKNATLE
jgi:hypothetical protein